MTECPKCGATTIYDNRAAKASGELAATRPDFKCKACGHAEWLTKKGTKGPTRPGRSAPKTVGELTRAAEWCLRRGEQLATAAGTRSKLPVTLTDILSVAEMLFEVVMRDGVIQDAPATPTTAPLSAPPAQLVAAAEERDDLPF